MSDSLRVRRARVNGFRDVLLAIAVAALGLSVFGGDVTIPRSAIAGSLLMVTGGLLLVAAIIGFRRGMRSGRG
ncbi:hypothetical protein [Brachybacterium sp. UNK5269]|uniref:hypothetical protein n=1 Tax=Brachybacterium sp. UNK5269 TaxID=3408576 RepID=UPI003BB05FF6